MGIHSLTSCFTKKKTGDDLIQLASGGGMFDAVAKAGRFRIFTRTEGISTTEVQDWLTQLALNEEAGGGREDIKDNAGQSGDSEEEADQKPNATATTPTTIAAAPEMRFVVTASRIAQFMVGNKPRELAKRIVLHRW